MEQKINPRTGRFNFLSNKITDIGGLNQTLKGGVLQVQEIRPNLPSTSVSSLYYLITNNRPANSKVCIKHKIKIGESFSLGENDQGSVLYDDGVRIDGIDFSGSNRFRKNAGSTMTIEATSLASVTVLIETNFKEGGIYYHDSEGWHYSEINKGTVYNRSNNKFFEFDYAARGNKLMPLQQSSCRQITYWKRNGGCFSIMDRKREMWKRTDNCYAGFSDRTKIIKNQITANDFFVRSYDESTGKYYIKLPNKNLVVFPYRLYPTRNYIYLDILGVYSSSLTGRIPKKGSVHTFKHPIFRIEKIRILYNPVKKVIKIEDNW